MFILPAGRPMPAAQNENVFLLCAPSHPAVPGVTLCGSSIPSAPHANSHGLQQRIRHATMPVTMQGHAELCIVVPLSRTDAEAGKVLAVAKHGDDAAHAVVAAVAALGPQPRLCRRRVQVVVYHQHMVLLHLPFAQRWRQWLHSLPMGARWHPAHVALSNITQQHSSVRCYAAHPWRWRLFVSTAGPTL